MELLETELPPTTLGKFAAPRDPRVGLKQFRFQRLVDNASAFLDREDQFNQILAFLKAPDRVSAIVFAPALSDDEFFLVETRLELELTLLSDAESGGIRIVPTKIQWDTPEKVAVQLIEQIRDRLHHDWASSVPTHSEQRTYLIKVTPSISRRVFSDIKARETLREGIEAFISDASSSKRLDGVKLILLAKVEQLEASADEEPLKAFASGLNAISSSIKVVNLPPPKKIFPDDIEIWAEEYAACLERFFSDRDGTIATAELTDSIRQLLYSFRLEAEADERDFKAHGLYMARIHKEINEYTQSICARYQVWLWL